MATATITSKGQVTIPVSVRHALGLDAGSKVEFVQQANGGFLMLPINLPASCLAGRVTPKTKPVSIEEMNQAIAEMAAKSLAIEGDQ